LTEINHKVSVLAKRLEARAPLRLGRNARSLQNL
jgi:hypothetical protein